VREAYEETGLVVEAERLVGIYSKLISAGEYVVNPKHYVIMTFLCRRVGGALQTSDETTDVRYFAPDALPDDIIPWHLQRIADAVAGRVEPFIR
jgi:8-oxo-dGTP pyrophosphatase MutT (NUDIX family)